MTDEPLVLAVDDLPANVRLLDAVLSPAATGCWAPGPARRRWRWSPSAAPT
jgi:hypothetical protein